MTVENLNTEAVNNTTPKNTEFHEELPSKTSTIIFFISFTILVALIIFGLIDRDTALEQSSYATAFIVTLIVALVSGLW